MALPAPAEVFRHYEMSGRRFGRYGGGHEDERKPCVSTETRTDLVVSPQANQLRRQHVPACGAESSVLLNGPVISVQPRFFGRHFIQAGA